jgi:hypothetical protein
MRRSALLLAALWWLAPPAFAGSDGQTDEPQILHNVTYQDVRLVFGLGYTTFSVNGERLAGAGLDAGAVFGINSRWGVGLSLRQGFTQTLTALFTSIEISVTYAITGSMRLENRQTLVDGKKLVMASAFNSGGFFGQLYLDQYFINTTDSIIPFPGLGLGVVYEFPSDGSRNFAVGVRIDRLSNDLNVLTPVIGFLRYSFWM